MQQSKIIALSKNGVIDRSKTAYDRSIFGDKNQTEIAAYISTTDPVYREALKQGYNITEIAPEEWNRLNQPDPFEIEKQQEISSRQKFLDNSVIDMLFELDNRIDNPKMNTPIKDKWLRTKADVESIRKINNRKELDEFLAKSSSIKP